MAIATSTAIIAGVAIAASTAGAAIQAKNAQATAAYNREVAEMNKKIALENAADVRARGRIAVFDQRRAVARAIGKTRASLAGAGVVVDEAGTISQDAVDAMREAGELDVLRLQSNIEREERRALIQAANFEAEAGAFELERKQNNPFQAAAFAGVNRAASIGLAVTG